MPTSTFPAENDSRVTRSSFARRNRAPRSVCSWCTRNSKRRGRSRRPGRPRLLLLPHRPACSKGIRFVLSPCVLTLCSRSCNRTKTLLGGAVFWCCYTASCPGYREGKKEEKERGRKRKKKREERGRGKKEERDEYGVCIENLRVHVSSAVAAVAAAAEAVMAAFDSSLLEYPRACPPRPRPRPSPRPPRSPLHP